MPIAVELTLDDKTSAHLHTLWQGIQALGLRNKTPRLNSTPHITLALYEDKHWHGLVSRCAEFTDTQPPVTVAFDHMGMFNNKHKVLFLAPNVTPELLNLRRAWLALTNDLPQWSKAADGGKRWAPHATLAKRLRAAQAQQALAHLMQADLPTRATITGVHLNQFTDPFASSVMTFSGK